jgi:hypothetical protein
MAGSGHQGDITAFGPVGGTGGEHGSGGLLLGWRRRQLSRCPVSALAVGLCLRLQEQELSGLERLLLFDSEHLVIDASLQLGARTFKRLIGETPLRETDQDAAPTRG